MSTSLRSVSRWLLAGAALLSSVVLFPSIAEAGGGEGKISLPDGPASVQGLGRSFVPSLATGTSSYGVDIELPPAANGHQPKLSFEYDSGGGVSSLGASWRLGGIPSIQRRISDGLPRFDASDEFELSGMGLPAPLVPVGGGFYRPEVESGVFARVKNGTGGRWEVRTKAGQIYRLGGEGYVEGEDAISYLLHEQLDLNGHRIVYEWDTETEYALLTRVVWNDYGEDVRQTIELSYEERPDIHELYSSGIRQVLDKRLKRVSVKLGGKLVRAYAFTYDEGALPRIETIRLFGTDDETSLPTLQFRYTKASVAADGQITTMVDGPSRAPSGDHALTDMDGDSLPDLLVGTAGSYRTYINKNGKSWTSGLDWAAAESPSASLSDEGIQLADADGDGATDLLIKSGGTSFRYLKGKDALSFGASQMVDTVPSVSFEDPEVRLVDMDGDRRADVVRSSPAGWSIAYNLEGTDWSAAEQIGAIDSKQELLFSDGKTTLCDVNGDRLQDVCFLRSGSLAYYLGRGRGEFAAARQATGVPDWEGEPFQLVDLDGNGWVDLVHVGVTEVSFALAEKAGAFAKVRRISGTPTGSSDQVVDFADMNGSGTTDIVWVDPASTEEPWRYLELFPEGRAGLLSQIDNGMGLVTRITYEPAAASAARDRAAGKPWVSRMNLAMPVVREYETDVGLGDPVVVTRYHYGEGTFDPVERTFAGFARGVQSQLGDEFTPTLVSESTFDPGVERRSLRGQVLSAEQRNEAGYVFSRALSTYVTRSLGTGNIEYSFLASTRQEIVEGQEDAIRVLLTEYEQDDFGNAIEERKWGEIDGEDYLSGDDEQIVVRTFSQDEDEWVLGRIASEETTNVDGRRLALSRSYYDGPDFEGLPLGQVVRGNVTRQEAWSGPDEDDFQLLTATAYNSDGQPVETKDGIGGGRFFTWDDNDRTTLLTEEVKTGSNVELIEVAVTDRRFGALLSVTAYDGQQTSFEYDVLGRLIHIHKPGDSEGAPSTSYEYQLGAPLSHVITRDRVTGGTDDYQHSVLLVDGAGRERGTLTKGEKKWVLAGANLLDARGQARRVQRPRFIEEDELDEPSLLQVAPGVTSYRDATARAIRTVTDMGIEQRTEYEPLKTLVWDGGQSDPSSSYEHTPTVTYQDGLGRTVKVERTLDGALVSASFGYDALGNLVQRVDPEGNTSSYEYDGRSRRTKVVDPDAGAHSFTFDPAGNMVSRSRPDGAVLHYDYDKLSRLVAEDWDEDGKSEIRRYWDEHPTKGKLASFRGRLARVEDESGARDLEYDERGRVIWTHLEIGGERYSSGSRFDNLDREILHIFPDASSIKIRRNLRGQLSGYGQAVDVFFDGDGVELERHFNTGVKQQYGYDDDRRLDELVARDAGGDTIEHLKWHFDATGNLERLEDLRPDVAEKKDRSEQYAYDNLSRLTAAEGTWGRTDFRYSLSGNLIERTSSWEAQDAGEVQYGGASPHAPTKFGEQTLKYDKLGRLLQDGTRTYRWNLADQLVKVEGQKSAKSISEFDADGKRRLRRETDSGGKTTETHFISPWEEVKDGKLIRYVVHADRRIVRLAEDNGAASAPPVFEPPAPPVSWKWSLGALLLAFFAFFVSGWNRLGRGAAVGLRWTTVAVLAIAVAGCGRNRGPGDGEEFDFDGSVKTLSAADTLLFTDQLGSLLSETNGEGALQAEFAALPYGQARTNTTTQTEKYAGAPRDESVGLDQMGARFYAPAFGMWTSPDPVVIDDPEVLVSGEYATANPYVYANLNPVIAKDADGNFWHVVAGAGIGALMGGGMEAATQYLQHGEVKDWGRVGSAAAGGAVSGAITAAAPGVGFVARALSSSASSVAGGMTTRVIASGGASVGSVSEIAVDATIGAVTGGRGSAKPKPHPKPAVKPVSKPPVAKAGGGGEPQFFRGAKPGESPNFTPRPNDFKVDKTTGFVRDTHGVSVFDNPGSVSKKGYVPHEVNQASISPSLRIQQRGADPTHFEIMPRPGANLTPAEFTAACQGILCR